MAPPSPLPFFSPSLTMPSSCCSSTASSSASFDEGCSSSSGSSGDDHAWYSSNLHAPSSSRSSLSTQTRRADTASEASGTCVPAMVGNYHQTRRQQRRQQQRQRTKVGMDGHGLPLSDKYDTNSNGHKRPRSARAGTNSYLTATLAIVGLCSLLAATFPATSPTLLAFTRRLEMARRLACEVYLSGTAEGDYITSWEDLFAPATAVADAVPCEGCSPPTPPETDLAFLVPLLRCPQDEDHRPGVDHINDPERAFYDAAALLKYSVCAECAELSFASKYNHTFYAMVHPEARYCNDGDAGTYDRVAVLQSLGYWVEVKGEPVGVEEISAPYIQDHVMDDVGIRDLMRLHAFTLTHHKVVVLVDFTTLLLQPLDDAVDALLSSPDSQVAFSMDYATSGVAPANGLNHGANTGLLMLKPSWNEYSRLVSAYRNTPYHPETGWNEEGIVGFEGVLGASGLITYYYRNRPFIELDKCIYNNDVSSPTDADGNCLDGNDTCDDCRLIPPQRIEAARFSESICGKPWECPWKDDEWDDPTKEICRHYLSTWFQKRLRFEQEYWIGGLEQHRNGTLHVDVFLGYCDTTGPEGYVLMIPDNVVYEPSKTAITVSTE